jgi:hypothetical protein
MKYKPGELVEIVRTITTEPLHGTTVDTISEEYMGKLGVIIFCDQKKLIYQLLIDPSDDLVDVYEEEIELV